MKPALTFFCPVHEARSSTRTPSTGLGHWKLGLGPICAMNVLCDLTQVTLSVFVHRLDNGACCWFRTPRAEQTIKARR